MMISRGRSSGSGIFIGQAETSSIIIVDMGGIFPRRGARRRKLGWGGGDSWRLVFVLCIG